MNFDLELLKTVVDYAKPESEGHYHAVQEVLQELNAHAAYADEATFQAVYAALKHMYAGEVEW